MSFVSVVIFQCPSCYYSLFRGGKAQMTGNEAFSHSRNSNRWKEVRAL